ncbi:hypothetical protein GA0070216_115115 [Micromonospora matsumotoense]|uniref:Uncharacterized protein n=1 Tax=Micromonospora matsumotoense TaxID=121616 RepID=A0A1C5AC01_9ACTN|nr:hypothetical protein [Micromonospora matsumotoense]SCF42733.1 hypothetical protein GA0070216_115115 [Micromonospora matsumotoense]
MSRSSRARKARKSAESGHAPQPGAAENTEAITVGRETNRIANKTYALNAILGSLGLIATLAGISAAFYVGVKPAPEPIGPKLRVSAFSAEKLSSIQADVLDLGSPAGKAEIESPVLDVVLKNIGDQVAVVSEVYFTFRYSQKIETCEKGGSPIEIAGRYDIKIPFPDRPTPFSINQVVRHQIPAGKTERLVFSIGIGKLPEYSDIWLYQIDMHVKFDGGVEDIHAGTGLVVTPVPSKGYFLNQKNIPDKNCPSRTLNQVRKFVASSGARSAAFEEILEELARFASR